MDARESVQELMQGIGAAHFCEGVEKVDYALIERLKKEVDLLVQSDIHQAVRLAEVLHTLSLQIDDPLAHALGLRARAQTLYYVGRYEETIEFQQRAAAIYRSQEEPVEAARMARSMLGPLMPLGRYEEVFIRITGLRSSSLANLNLPMGG